MGLVLGVTPDQSDEVSVWSACIGRMSMKNSCSVCVCWQEAKGLLAGEKLADTRQETKAKRKSKGGSGKRSSTADKIVEEGQCAHIAQPRSDLRNHSPSQFDLLVLAWLTKYTATDCNFIKVCGYSGLLMQCCFPVCSQGVVLWPGPIWRASSAQALGPPRPNTCSQEGWNYAKNCQGKEINTAWHCTFCAVHRFLSSN